MDQQSLSGTSMRVSGLFWFTSLVFIFFANHAHSAPIEEQGMTFLPDSAIVLDDGYRLSGQGVAASVFLFLAVIALWGRGYYDATLFSSRCRTAVGFITLGFVSWVLLTNFEPADTYGRNRWTIYLVVPIACGLVGSFLISAFFRIHLAIMGGLGGLALGLWILGWVSGLSITSNWGRAVLLVLLSVFGMVIAASHPTGHILGAGLAGAYILLLSLDIYFHTGFTYCLLLTLDNNAYHHYTYQVRRETHIFQAVFIVATVIGSILQYHRYSEIIKYNHDLSKPIPVQPWFLPGRFPFWPGRFWAPPPS